MADTLKQLVGLSKGELITMGHQIGLTFHDGMRKVDMAQQLQASAASGWMEVNQELMSGHEEVYDESGSAMMFEGHTVLSDAAHIAQILSSAGHTESFHAAMNGPSHHVEAVHSYLGQLGVSTDDVWKHMPKANANIPAQHWGSLNNYLRDNLTAHQDFMRAIPGHHESNFMDEFSTNKGGVQQSYEYLSHMYVDREQYSSKESYQRDLDLVTSRLQTNLGGRFAEAAYSSAQGAPTSYISALPMLGNPDIVRGIQHARNPLNVSGLPLGSYGAGINADYSLSASLTGKPGWSPESSAVYGDVSEAAKSLAKVYSGGVDRGISAVGLPPQSDFERLVDSASRFMDLDEARSAYNNLDEEIRDTHNHALNVMASNTWDKLDAESSAAPGVPNAGFRMPTISEVGRDFTADIGAPTFANPAFERREARRIAELDAAHANFRDTSGYGSGRSTSSGPVYHFEVKQGTPEWLAERAKYDLTGSTTGAMLGQSETTRPWAEMIDRLGLQRGKGSKNANAFTQRMFAKGHETEDKARADLSRELGIEIQQVGYITNEDFPGMIYSPDGLIGDDALWEHKNPENAKAGFADLLAGDHPDYMTQIQAGMAMTGRSRTLVSQTRRGERRDQWIDADPDWYANNKDKLDSIRGRLAAGREWLDANPGEANDPERIKGARAAMMGEGIWKDVKQRSDQGYSENAGVRGMDPFIDRIPQPTQRDAGSDYQPNWTFARNNPVPPELLGLGYNPSAPSGETVSGGTVHPLSTAVKDGILAAQEENRQKGSTQNTFDGQSTRVEPDADFTDDPYAPTRRRSGGGSGGNGGVNGGGGSGFDGDDVLRSLASGSIAGASRGMFGAMAKSPWGLAAAAAIGTVAIGNEVAENINEFIGQAEDAGLSNPNEYSAMNLGMQQLGLSESQATQVNATTHSAYNTLLNGDPSGAVRIVTGMRGLLTIGDIREAKGDPVALAAIAQQRGKERGWSQERMAGAFQMAGLPGMARATNRSEYSIGQATQTVQAGRDSEYAEGIAANDTLQSNRADLNVAQNALQAAVSHGAPVLTGARNAIIDARTAVGSAVDGVTAAHNFIMGEESGGRDLDANGNVLTSSTGAQGRMQVLSSTNRDPGFGVRPAQNDSLEERARVGRDYYDAMVARYGDTRKAMAAYTDGPGTVDSAMKNYGGDWLSHMPTQAQNRVKKYDEWVAKGNDVQQGADMFNRNGVSYGQAPVNVNVNVNAVVNNKQASATTTVNGQTVTQSQNMGNGASQRR